MRLRMMLHQRPMLRHAAPEEAHTGQRIGRKPASVSSRMGTHSLCVRSGLGAQLVQSVCCITWCLDVHGAKILSTCLLDGKYTTQCLLDA